jgi:hypothetical protein
MASILPTRQIKAESCFFDHFVQGVPGFIRPFFDILPNFFAGVINLIQFLYHLLPPLLRDY